MEPRGRTGNEQRQLPIESKLEIWISLADEVEASMLDP
jgi:hypothetical protein